MSLTLKISSAILGILIFSVSLLIFLTYFKYESTMASLVRSRFSVVANDIQTTVSNGLSLGVTLSELQTTQEVIENAKASDDQILSIKVFELVDESVAKTVYNTRLAGVGGGIPESWLKTMFASKPFEPWSLQSSEGNIVGTTLINNFGKPIGGIVVRYSEKYVKDKTRSVLGDLLQNSSLVLSIACIIVIFGSFIFIRPISRKFKNISRFLLSNEQIEKAEWDSYKVQSDIEDLFVQAGKKGAVLIETLEKIKSSMNNAPIKTGESL